MQNTKHENKKRSSYHQENCMNATSAIISEKDMAGGLKKYRALLTIFLTISISLSIIIINSFKIKFYGEQSIKIFEEYNVIEEVLNDFLETSDYLTNQVYIFATTKKVEYVDNYFIELTEKQNREIAVQKFKDSITNSKNYLALRRSLKYSDELSDIEIHAMKLICEAEKIDNHYLHAYQLSEDEMNLSQIQKIYKAYEILFGEVYQQKKNLIQQNNYAVLQEFSKLTKKSINENYENLRGMVFKFKILIGVFCFFNLIILIVLILYILQFKKYAETDALTGLCNRYAFQKTCAALCGTKLGVIFMMCDIDLFKKINDIYGHSIGDKTLCEIANHLKSISPERNQVFRVGGDEIVLVLKNEKYENIEAYCKKLDAINEKLLQSNDNRPACSISIGIAFSENGFSKELYENADKALYCAKEKGGKQWFH